MNRPAITATLIACVTMLVASCEKTETASSKAQVQREHSVANNEIVVASYPSLDEGIKIASERYKKLHPEVTIRLTSLSFTDHHNSLVTGLATGVSLPDAVGIEVGFLGRLIESGTLEDLGKSPYNARQYSDQLLPFTLAQASRRDGVLVAMPVDIGPGSLFYRKDILDKAGVTEDDLTASWESFIESGKKIKEKTGAYLVPNASSLSDLYIRSNVPRGEGIYFDKNDHPIVTSERFQRAFALAKAARDAELDGKFAPWTTEWFEGFKRGTFAAEMSGAWLAGHLAKYIAPQSAGLWRAAPLPGGASASWGGSFYAIPKQLPQARKAAAWEFIKFLALDQEMQIAALKGLDAYPALIEAANDKFFDEPIAYLGGQRARLLWRDTARKVPPLEVNRLDPIAAQILATELDRVLELDKPINDALATAQRVIERRIRR
jgi:multiple sugar transport system substrate-binding protein